jgi:two-component system response regulator LytT
MHALIVEDEPLAARSLQQLLGDFAPDIEGEGPYPSIAATLARLRSGPAPDLLFMDVELADGLCFELFDAFPISAPVIFTTAYDQFAIRAFEVFGIDYLLKPIRPSRFALALGKWRRLRAAGQATDMQTASLATAYFHAAQTWRTRFLVAQGENFVSIAVSDIAYFQKELVVRIVTHTGARHTLSQSLDDLEKMLDPDLFFRANRQTLVSYAAIRRIGRASKGKLLVEVTPPAIDEIVVSQERATALRAWLDR